MLDGGKLNKHILVLDSGDDAARRDMLTTLRAYEEPDWANVPVEPLRTLIGSLKTLSVGMKQPFVHKEVAKIIGSIGPQAKSAIPQLIELLREGTPDPVREAAVAALGKCGKQAKTAVDKMLPLLENGRPSLCTQVIRALGNIGSADQKVKTALVDLWGSPTQLAGSQAQVAIALCKLKIDANGLLRTVTKNLVSNQDDTLRTAAAEALACCATGDLDVVPALLHSALGDSREDVRLKAQAGLDQLGLTHEQSVRICAKQLKDSVYAEGALRKSGPLAVPALIEALAASDATVRIKSAQILGTLGEGAVQAAPALTKILSDKDTDVRLAGAKSLWAITKNAEAVVPVLVRLLELKGDLEASETRRMFLQTVMEALRRIGPPATSAVPALKVMAKESNRLIRESALITLEKIAPAPVGKGPGR